MGLIKRVIRAKVKTPLKRAVRKKVTRPARAKVQQATSVECRVCHKRYTNPLTHTCSVKTDFAKRKAAVERRAKAEVKRQRRRESAARKREAAKARRKAAADRRKAAAAERRRKAREKRPAPAPRPVHDYRLCSDDECARHACKAYKDGLADCPLGHT